MDRTSAGLSLFDFLEAQLHSKSFLVHAMQLGFDSSHFFRRRRPTDTGVSINTHLIISCHLQVKQPETVFSREYPALNRFVDGIVLSRYGGGEEN